jgi:ribosomal protein L3 glutamine methyltransferase
MTELHTIRDFLRFALSEFGRHPIELGHGTDSLWDEALALVFGALSLPPDGDERLLDASLTSDERRHVLDLIHKRVHERIPVPYLTKKAWYAGLPFIVDERVLIPRSPIFELIETEFKPWFDAPVERPIRFLDLCTGSGCLGITTALAFPESTGVLADLESGACQVARENVDFHQVGDRLEVIQSDGFDALFDDTFDVIICNPPYVDAEDMADLPPEYRKEPEIALASGDDGLELVRRLLSQAFDWLADDGIMILEVGNTWGLLDREVTARTGEPVQWLEFEFGGHGVCVLSKHELNTLYSAF